MQLALGDVCDLEGRREASVVEKYPRGGLLALASTSSMATHHQLAGDLRDGHAEGEQVQAGVALEQLAGRLLENDEGQGEHEPDLGAGTQHAGVLNRQNFSRCGKRRRI